MLYKYVIITLKEGAKIRHCDFISKIIKCLAKIYNNTVFCLPTWFKLRKVVSNNKMLVSIYHFINFANKNSTFLCNI